MERRKLFGIAGTIVLGALGSGLWELIKPMGATAWNALLTVSTLGLDSLRDGLYQSAARLGAAGAREAAGTQVLGALISLTIASVMMQFLLVRRESSSSKSLSYFVPFVFLGGAIALLIAVTRTSYVTKVAAYYEQLSTITAPYLEPQVRLELASRCARAQGRKEYAEVISELELVLKTKSISFPKQELY